MKAKVTNRVICATSQGGKTGWASHLHNAWPGGYVRGRSGKLPRVSVFLNAKRVDYVQGPRCDSPDTVWKKVAHSANAPSSQKTWWRQPQWVPRDGGRSERDHKELLRLLDQALRFADRAGVREGCAPWFQLIVDETKRYDMDVIERVTAEGMGKGVVVTLLLQHLKQAPTEVRSNCATKVFLAQEPEGMTLAGYPWDEIDAWTRSAPYRAVSHRPRVGWRRHEALPDPARA